MVTGDELNSLAAQHLGRTQGDYRSACPICAKGGRDDAVNITIKPDGSAVAHCHRCGENGTARADHVNGTPRRPAARARPTRPAEDFKGLWDSASEPGEVFEHPYLTRKQVGAHGIRVRGDLLLVPMFNVENDLTGLQTINPAGIKLNAKGSRKTGSYYVIGQPEGRIVIVEGYATGCTVFKATNIATAIAFDCSNMVNVAKAIRAKYPTMTIIVGADDDAGTSGGNPGLTKATEAARAVGGA